MGRRNPLSADERRQLFEHFRVAVFMTELPLERIPRQIIVSPVHVRKLLGKPRIGIQRQR